MHKVFSFPEQGLSIEIGKYAKQADGAVWIKAGNSIVLATAVASKQAREFPGFFPLTVEYRERTSAAGKIPGGYIKREGKLSDLEVLTSRIIDRPIRPLFPSNYFCEVQILATVYSSDGKYPTSILGLIGSSLALTLSPIPFLGPVGAVQAGHINGKWVFNPTYEELSQSDAEITIAGTRAGICMVEGHCNNASEKELADLFSAAHEIIKKQVDWQLEIQKELNIKKTEIVDVVDWNLWKKRITDVLPADFVEQIFAATKVERSEGVDAIKQSIIDKLTDVIEAEKVSVSVIGYIFDSIVKEKLPDYIIKKQTRVDGRHFDEIRKIFAEVAPLPCVHGSAVFQRGETQAMASLTLGTGQDAQRVETLLGGERERSFMLHYNFPPFATGEVKPIRGASRRDIGHGYLAESTFLNVLPPKDKFPYVIRSVVDILESNGSSSMATVCATALALMDAGVPIKDVVGGIAMGLMRDSSGKLHILTDILGMEDAYGLMDFKVAGTQTGIMSFQLDIKDKVGLPHDLFIEALERAHKARLHIIAEMKKALEAPRPQISELAPRVSMIKVPTDKIGMIIGPSGKNIREIVAQTGAQIDIEDDGTVKIYAKSKESALAAESWIRTISGDIEIGSVFNGIIRRIAEFGLIVELVAGKEGMVHISTIARTKQRDLPSLYKIGDKLTVKVMAVDHETGRIRLIAPDLEKP
ncbi:MAG: polyribonucleotide nucleotidyltransferase [Candidatus Babeliales bacterium]|jgi:polyribonucleotide nucleotidyltransferase